MIPDLERLGAKDLSITIDEPSEMIKLGRLFVQPFCATARREMFYYWVCPEFSVSRGSSTPQC
jgi:hypothetical protein